MSAQHTPGPFYLNGNAQMHGAQWIADATGKPVALAEILHRCNAHDDLLVALDRIDSLMRDCLLGPTPLATDEQVQSILDAQRELRAAIAKARGQA
jgi:hypothetical protein